MIFSRCYYWYLIEFRTVLLDVVIHGDHRLATGVIGLEVVYIGAQWVLLGFFFKGAE